MSERYYRKFANCLSVRGYVRSVIVDLQRKNYWFVPNDLVDMIIDFPNSSIESICLVYQDRGVFVEEYFAFLFENEICFPCEKEDLELFPDLNHQWHTPFKFETAIVDYNSDLIKYLPKIISNLSNFAVPNIQFRVYELLSENAFVDLVKTCNDSKVSYIEIIVPNSFEIDFLESVIKNYTKLGLVVLTSSKFNDNRYIEQARIVRTKQIINSKDHCGLIKEGLFVNEMRSFCESYEFNSCLNCKISIDSTGNIKNCPSMQQSFGNIKDTTLEEALNHRDFKKYWNITKDKIEVCKDCEYRHMCTDCRAYIKQPDNIYSQPAKCTYNPYIAKWNNEVGYVPVGDCGYYNIDGKFVVDKLKVKEINSELWE